MVIAVVSWNWSQVCFKKGRFAKLLLGPPGFANQPHTNPTVKVATDQGSAQSEPRLHPTLTFQEAFLFKDFLLLQTCGKLKYLVWMGCWPTMIWDKGGGIVVCLVCQTSSTSWFTCSAFRMFFRWVCSHLASKPSFQLLYPQVPQIRAFLLREQSFSASNTSDFHTGKGINNFFRENP